MVDAAPAEVCDVDETVNTAEVNEYTVVGDVLNLSFEYLSLLEFADELSPSGLLLCLKKCLVGYDHIAELLIDLDDLEVDCLIYELVIVADRLYVDLTAREECLDAEYVNDHTALGAGLDKSLDNLVVLECFADAVPRFESTCLLV